MESEEKQKEDAITTADVKDIHEAVSLVGNSDLLSQSVSFDLGVMGGRCKTIVKTYEAWKAKATKALGEKQLEIRKEFKEATPERKKELAEELSLAQANFELEIERLLNKTHEDFKPKMFKLKDFAASEDNKQKDLEIKKGQTLVPVKFYTLMGKFITA